MARRRRTMVRMPMFRISDAARPDVLAIHISRQEHSLHSRARSCALPQAHTSPTNTLPQPASLQGTLHAWMARSPLPPYSNIYLSSRLLQGRPSITRYNLLTPTFDSKAFRDNELSHSSHRDAWYKPELHAPITYLFGVPQEL